MIWFFLYNLREKSWDKKVIKFSNLYTDNQWKIIKASMNWNPHPERGIKRNDLRKIWNTIFYVLIRGCRWIEIPNDREKHVPKSTAHRWLKQFQELNIYDKVMISVFKLKSHRWKVERTFAWIKRKCRRLILRWERLSVSWYCFFQIGADIYVAWAFIRIGSWIGQNIINRSSIGAT